MLDKSSLTPIKEDEFPQLRKILAYRKKTRKLYWASAILFWLGAAMALKYYIAQTGAVPSLIPGIFMFAAAGLYFFVYFFYKREKNN